ncbi:transposase [Streptomyces sp. NPDC008061]|uniref:transposase n=1 Tax=Streptomyces sp. NPDC008061 TaxID=3364805 RepID=UPI0036EA91E4
MIVSSPARCRGAEFIACTGGDTEAFASTGRLAGGAGLVPVPRDSGRISDNMLRPHRYHRRLLRAFYLSAQIAARSYPTSHTFYDRKRAEGKSHKQAILAPARQPDVLRALIRDQRTFEPQVEPDAIVEILLSRHAFSRGEGWSRRSVSA